MPQVLGFDVSVEVEGKKLPEYKPEVSVDPTTGVPVTTCWIPSEAGKEFCVTVVFPPAPRSRHWSFSLNLDGNTPVVKGSALLKTEAKTVRKLGEEVVSANVQRPFQFATIQLTDDDSALQGTSPDLGSIALFLHSCDDYIREGAQVAVSKTQAAGPIHEKAKKGLAHRVGFGEERPIGPLTWWTAVGKRLQAKVIFKYRNIDILIAEDIAPGRKRQAEAPKLARPPKAPLLASGPSTRPLSNTQAGPSNPRKRKIGEPQVKIEIDVEKELRLEQEEKELEARLASIRAKKAKTGDGTRVKREVKSEITPSSTPGEVIDLTEDD